MSDGELRPSSDGIKQKQEQILLELSATVNTLVSLDEVLQDITAQTSPDDDDDNPNNIARKQEMLLKELNEWKKVILQPSNAPRLR